MSDIFSSIENVIILYAPTLLVYITQAVDWIVSVKKFRSLDVSAQVAPVVSQVKSLKAEMKELTSEVKSFAKEKADLAESVSSLKDMVEAQKDEIASLKTYLQELTRENVQLKAALRSKSNDKPED